LLRPLGTAARVFFRHELTLRREDGRMQLTLEERLAPGEARPEAPADAAARKERERLALVRNELAAVLDELPGTRRALRHLVVVESALHSDGWQALQRLPVKVLRRALEQFEGLVTNWSPVGLATLRSKIAVAVNARAPAESGAEENDDPCPTASGALTEALPTPEVVALDGLPEAEAALAAAYAAALGAAAPPASPAAPAAPSGAGSPSSRAYSDA
jgi:hypothetical protein